MKKKLIISAFFICFIICIFLVIKFLDPPASYEDIFLSEVKAKINEQRSFILYIHQKDCQGCKRVRTCLDVFKKYPTIDTFGIDVSNYTDKDLDYLISEMGLSDTPTILFYKDGKEKSRIVGVFTENNLIEKITETYLH